MVRMCVCVLLRCSMHALVMGGGGGGDRWSGVGVWRVLLAVGSWRGEAAGTYAGGCRQHHVRRASLLSMIAHSVWHV